MFEEMTYEKILQDVLDNAPDGIDTRQVLKKPSH